MTKQEALSSLIDIGVRLDRVSDHVASGKYQTAARVAHQTQIELARFAARVKEMEDDELPTEA